MEEYLQVSLVMVWAPTYMVLHPLYQTAPKLLTKWSYGKKKKKMQNLNG